eukprot:scaffold38182_cov35-Tisochrysis_lutea.AAC.1
MAGSRAREARNPRSTTARASARPQSCRPARTIPFRRDRATALYPSIANTCGQEEAHAAQLPQRKASSSVAYGERPGRRHGVRARQRRPSAKSTAHK